MDLNTEEQQSGLAFQDITFAGLDVDRSPAGSADDAPDDLGSPLDQADNHNDPPPEYLVDAEVKQPGPFVDEPVGEDLQRVLDLHNAATNVLLKVAESEYNGNDELPNSSFKQAIATDSELSAV